ncbi:outer membrane protein assembly factor BamD [Dysgonomonas sp. 25]|uniref:outer membrane protein assembly factor BamD n=1 Tax=Dysgonomonas sp. 25 TaxID=2302933 RepID=UPI0013D66052|nr:outer membrane protein assembly factor BamD [Dysgonomonas sp. 25]NDV68000.1 outer membrane protein assembly factor BamD [Dysgonomonas sp. 25]
MKIKLFCTCLLATLLLSCGEYNKILKSNDAELRYEYAKKYFDEKKYGRTITLLESIMTTYVGSPKEQEIMFLLAQSYFFDKDYTTATYYYTQYFNRFSRGEYVELARFNAADALYLDSPDARLDQTNTIKAIQGFQDFLEYFPQSDKAQLAQERMFELQEKLAYKEFLSARLYYNLGTYMGNNYESCAITAREALKNYPFSAYAEEFQILILRSKFEEALNSIDEKKQARFYEVIDEHFNYKNLYPNGKFLKESEKRYLKAMQELGKEVDAVTEEAVEAEKAEFEKTK